MIKKQFSLATFCFIFSAFLLLSCGGSKEENEGDTMKTDTATKRLNPDSVVKADSTVTATIQMAKKDSAHIADSIANLKDPVRDFN